MKVIIEVCPGCLWYNILKSWSSSIFGNCSHCGRVTVLGQGEVENGKLIKFRG